MKEDKVVIGKIFSPHGVRGQVKIKSYSEPPELLLSLVPENGLGKELKITKRGVSKEGMICSIEGVENRDQAEELVGTDILCARSLLPESNEDEFYINDLLRCAVIENNQHVGEVIAVQNFGAGDILEIKFSTGSDFFPFNKQYFPEIDLTAGKITLKRPHES